MKYVTLLLVSCIATQSYADEAFDQRVIAAIMANPEVVILALEAIEQQREVEASRVSQGVIDQFADELFGPDEQVQLVEFFDYRCGYCARAAEAQQALADDVQAQIKWIEWPILGDVSKDLAKVSLAVRNIEGPEAYRTFHHAIFESQGRIGTTALALQLVQQLGWDIEAIRAEAESTNVARELRANEIMAQRLGIRGTPTYVSRDQVHRGMLNNDQIIEITRAAQSAQAQSE